MKSRRIQIALWDAPMQPFVELSELHLRFHFPKSMGFELALKNLENPLEESTVKYLRALWSDDSLSRQYSLEENFLVIFV
jgi:hypothetical protein